MEAAASKGFRRVCRSLRLAKQIKATRPRTTSVRGLSFDGTPEDDTLLDGAGENGHLIIKSVAQLDSSFLDTSPDIFRQRAFAPREPLVMKMDPNSVDQLLVPASAQSQEHNIGVTLAKWFEPMKDDTSIPKRIDLTAYVRSFQTHIVPYELRYPQRRPIHGDAVQHFIQWLRSEQAGRADDTVQLYAVLASILDSHVDSQLRPDEQAFVRFDAPLALLIAALDFNAAQVRAGRAIGTTLRNLYVAQCALADLPAALAADLPTPAIVQGAGRGDVYGTSVWMGLERTYTPLHRDPNPNLFVQLCGHKEVRLLPPLAGDALYYQVQMALLQRGSRRVGPAVRGDEMMQGDESVLWRNAIWPVGRTQLPLPWAKKKQTVLEARLDRGDALFIPKGWWHSVQSTLGDGRLNCSANWWFR